MTSSLIFILHSGFIRFNFCLISLQLGCNGKQCITMSVLRPGMPTKDQANSLSKVINWCLSFLSNLAPIKTILGSASVSEIHLQRWLNISLTSFHVYWLDRGVPWVASASPSPSTWTVLRSTLMSANIPAWLVLRGIAGHHSEKSNFSILAILFIYIKVKQKVTRKKIHSLSKNMWVQQGKMTD